MIVDGRTVRLFGDGFQLGNVDCIAIFGTGGNVDNLAGVTSIADGNGAFVAFDGGTDGCDICRIRIGHSIDGASGRTGAVCCVSAYGHGGAIGLGCGPQRHTAILARLGAVAEGRAVCFGRIGVVAEGDGVLFLRFGGVAYGHGIFRIIGNRCPITDCHGVIGSFTHTGAGTGSKGIYAFRTIVVVVVHLRPVVIDAVIMCLRRFELGNVDGISVSGTGGDVMNLTANLLSGPYPVGHEGYAFGFTANADPSGIALGRRYRRFICCICAWHDITGITHSQAVRGAECTQRHTKINAVFAADTEGSAVEGGRFTPRTQRT